ncbi:MAG: transglutaminase-like putative cysteine protease [Akkermansiaceae bacterium]
MVYLLLVGGVLSVAARYYLRASMRFDSDETAWRLTYTIECEARRAGAELRVASPADTQSSRVFRQEFRQENLRIDPRGQSSVLARDIVALAEKPGRCESTFRFDLRLNPKKNWSGDSSPVTLSANERARYLRASARIPIDHPEVQATLAKLRERSSDQGSLLHAIFEHCHRDILCAEQDAAEDAATVLEDGSGTPRGCVRAMIALCRAAKIPARPVTGFVIQSGEHRSANIWLEVLVIDHWAPCDPINGYKQVLPYNYIPARHDDERVVITRQADDLETEFTVAPLPRSSLGATAAERGLSDILDLTRLPVERQQILSLILLMPLGALATSIFRNLVGLRTSGTFTPTLMALSFVFADWRTVLLIFGTVIVLGVSTRYLIDRLRLLILPRLSIMLTLVVLCIVFGISALEYLQITPGSQAVLLPMVILTMLIERFYLTTQEDGMRVALQHLGGTFLVGFCCYLLFRWETAAALLLAYPEAHLFTIALLVLLGRYTGYQLLEPFRFKDFAPTRRG